MALAPTVRVEGLREVNRAFRAIDRSLATQLGNDMKKAAEPVRVDAVGLISRYRGASLGTIRTRRTGLRVFVEQGARKVTGKRGDFGALQLKRGLIPALEQNRAGVLRDVDDVLNRYSDREGF